MPLRMSGQMATVLLLFLTALGGFAIGVIVTLLLKGKAHQPLKESDAP